MKKGQKAILIASGILLGTGVLATSAGLMMGARMQDVTVDGRNAMGWYQEVNSNARDKTSTVSTGGWDTLVNESYTDVTSLNIMAEAGHVIVKNGDTFSVVADGKNVKIRSYVENGEWTIDSGRVNKIHLKDINYEMVVTIPKDWQAHEIDIELGAGMLEAERLAAYEVSLEVGMGQIEVEELESRDTNIDCAMGQVTVDRAILSGETDIECGMGQIELTVAGNEDDYGYSYNVGMGTVQIGSVSSSGLAAEKSGNKGAPNRIDADCGMGQIMVDFEE